MEQTILQEMCSTSEYMGSYCKAAKKI